MIVKVCGMRDAQNIREVDGSGTDWMGFIFYSKSPRYVANKPAFLPLAAKRIGVFVNAGRDEIINKAHEFGLWGIQLHGNEDATLCDALRSHGLQVIKAISVGSANDVRRAEPFIGHADYFLFDTATPTHGGSGRSFDWSVLNSYHGRTPFLLSGGLNPQSLAALRKFSHDKWAGIDLNSGFETAPAQKNAASIAQFIASFRGIGAGATPHKHKL